LKGSLVAHLHSAQNHHISLHTSPKSTRTYIEEIFLQHLSQKIVTMLQNYCKQCQNVTFLGALEPYFHLPIRKYANLTNLIIVIKHKKQFKKNLAVGVDTLCFQLGKFIEYCYWSVEKI